jgi:hypothetical protein
MSTQPLASYSLLFLLATPYFCYPLIFYLLGEPAFLLVVRMPIHSCPWFAINCPPFAASPTNTPHRSSYNIYIDNINNISRPRLKHTV